MTSFKPDLSDLLKQLNVIFFIYYENILRQDNCVRTIQDSTVFMTFLKRRFPATKGPATYSAYQIWAKCANISREMLLYHLQFDWLIF